MGLTDDEAGVGGGGDCDRPLHKSLEVNLVFVEV